MTEQEQNSQPFVSHLIELRNRLLWALGTVLVIFLCLAPFANDLYEWFAKPVMANLPQGSTMISTEPHGPFFIPFKFDFVVFPIIFNFFANAAPDGVAVMPDISSYMSFALKLFFAFGISFEVPVATVLLSKMGVVSADSMAEKRPYIIVGAFIVGMLMTPPDIFSQVMLAVPVWLLFEAGLFFARKLERKQLASQESN